MDVLKHWIEYDERGHGHFMVLEPDNETVKELDKIWGLQDMDNVTKQQMIDRELLVFDIHVVTPPSCKDDDDSRNRGRSRRGSRLSKVTLGLASDAKKVTLKVIGPSEKPKKIYAYVLYLKGTDKFIWRISKEGVYLARSPKTRPVYFTVADMRHIKNLSDFDAKKVEYPGSYIKNKIVVGITEENKDD